jgi:hypothetical protein
VPKRRADGRTFKPIERSLAVASADVRPLTRDVSADVSGVAAGSASVVVPIMLSSAVALGSGNNDRVAEFFRQRVH